MFGSNNNQQVINNSTVECTNDVCYYNNMY